MGEGVGILSSFFFGWGVVSTPFLCASWVWKVRSGEGGGTGRGD